MKKLLFALGLLVLANLQYSLFFTNNNISDFFSLNSQNNILKEKIGTLSAKNNVLLYEINELSTSTHALETFARYNLGLVKDDETFVHVIKK
tara:strand:- start:515 stop:790 length:276 start_codon:yes stop_codon:yes gene_type:complete